MYRRPTKKQELIRRTITYSLMTLLVLVIVAGLVLVVLGYRLDSDSGRIEQGALMQFETIPAGASVKIDGTMIGSKTSMKSSVLAGTHTFEMSKDGYETWQKTLDVTAGTLTWLDYARLVPKDIKVESVTSYPSVYGSLATLDGRTMLIQQSATTPTFQVVDLRADDVKSSTITVPSSVYSDATTSGITHTFTLSQWDSGGRFILIKHDYGSKKEWLVMDTKDANNTKNITSLLDIDISSIVLSGTSGNIFYALTGSDIRKLDLSAETISRSLIANVSSFELFETNIITYIGTRPSDSSKRVVGLYVEGDNAPHVLRTVTSDTSVPLHITTSHYFNHDYVAISEGSKVDIISGSYPASGSDDNSSLADFATLSTSASVDLLSFSPKGDYLLVRSGADFASYDIEHQRVIDYTLPETNVAVKWLDDDHTWSDYGSKLIMREFDGANASVLSDVVVGQSSGLTSNDRYIYSIGTSGSGFQLQRVRMVLP